jgi:hypothetical protein
VPCFECGRLHDRLESNGSVLLHTLTFVQYNCTPPRVIF